MMLTGWIAALIAALAAPAAVPASAPLPDADPAMWVVNDEDTVIYLFGTFHALDGRSQWFNDEVATAFAAADELLLETVVAQPNAGPAQPAPEPRSPFMASTRLAISAGKTRGMRIDRGADSVLRSAAERLGKPVGGLEPAEAQHELFADLSSRPPSAAAAPGAAVALADLMSRMQAAWNQGDQSYFEGLLYRLEAHSPDTYRRLFEERNGRWAKWIAERLGRPGTVFVAVGAGHLAGRDSVQRKLAERHIRAARIS